MGDAGLGYYKDIKYGVAPETSSLSNCDVRGEIQRECVCVCVYTVRVREIESGIFESAGPVLIFSVVSGDG